MCSHYPSRKCEIYAICCGRWYSCHVCHNESEPHEVNRSTGIQRMRCDVCHKEQSCAQTCKFCNTCLSSYYCGLCHLWSEGNIWHCAKCGFCRMSTNAEVCQMDYIHCDNCKMCFHRDAMHKCLRIENDQVCVICMDETPLYKSRVQVVDFGCGHFFHGSCMREWVRRSSQCPICRYDQNDAHFRKCLKEWTSDGFKYERTINEVCYIYVIRNELAELPILETFQFERMNMGYGVSIQPRIMREYISDENAILRAKSLIGIYRKVNE